MVRFVVNRRDVVLAAVLLGASAKKRVQERGDNRQEADEKGRGQGSVYDLGRF